MRRRLERQNVTGQEEEALEQSIRDMAHGDVESPPPPAFWSSQIVQINQRIDNATSGVALSLSWAARVAIPGVVAVLAFLIGLKYYAPERSAAESLRQATASLESAAVESLYVASVAVHDTAIIGEIAKSLTPANHVEATDYYLEHAPASALVNDLTDQEFNEVLAALTSVDTK